MPMPMPYSLAVIAAGICLWVVGFDSASPLVNFFSFVVGWIVILCGAIEFFDRLYIGAMEE